MLFSSTEFIFVFLPLVLFGYHVVFRNRRWVQNLFLVLVSLFFYAWGEPKFVLVMLASIVLNWLFALWVDRCRQKKGECRLALGMMLACNLGILFIFKYLAFVSQNISLILGVAPLRGLGEIKLPIGISFFTFQAISYVIDIYRGKGEVQKNIINVALYISFFPQLIAGPIVRYQTIAEQIKGRRETWDGFAAGINRFMVGICKKVLLANTLALVADQAFAAGTATTVVFAWLGALAYTFQIYFDFGGYSDMAIGLGQMFGFHFLENFDYPYVSASISEFWRRWHISLGSWFRDYIYIPLGGSRVSSTKRLVFNTFVVWLLTGIWHGANWTFIVWGMMYFVLIMMEKLTGIEKKHPLFARLYTPLFVVLGWVIFRAESLSAAALYIAQMFGAGTLGFIDDTAIFVFLENKWYFLFAAVFSLPVVPWLAKKTAKSNTAAILSPVLLCLGFLAAVSYLVKGAYNPFIYFNF